MGVAPMYSFCIQPVGLSTWLRTTGRCSGRLRRPLSSHVRFHSRTVMQLFVSHFVVVEESVWLDTIEPFPVSRQTELHRLVSQLFAAPDREAAHAKASQMIDGLSDSHCDGPGDRTNIRCLGIHELEEVSLAGHSLAEALNGPYGIDAGSIHWSSKVPSARDKHELSIFASHGT